MAGQSKDWAKVLPIVTHLLNNRPFLGSELTPTQLQFGLKSNFGGNVRPEQQLIFKSLIPPKKEEAETFLDKLKNMEESLKKTRQTAKDKVNQKVNENKKLHTFKEGQICLVKRRYVALGTSTKLQLAFNPIPHTIEKIAKYLIFVKSLLDGTLSPRMPSDLRIISGITNQQLEEGNIPEDLLQMFKIIRSEDLLELFHDQEDTPETMKTRSKTKMKDLLDADSVLEEYLSFPLQEGEHREVTFE